MNLQELPQISESIRKRYYAPIHITKYSPKLLNYLLLRLFVYITVYTFYMEANMKTAKLFQNGSSQAVRLPKEYQFAGTDVYVKKFDTIVILIPKDGAWSSMINSLDHFSDDFLNDRNQSDMQSREMFS